MAEVADISNFIVADVIKSTSAIPVKKSKAHRTYKNPKKIPAKPKEKIAGQVFLIVKYDGEKYSAETILPTNGSDNESIYREANEYAESLTIKYNHKKYGYQAVPIHIPGTIPVMYLNLEVPTYYKNTKYYATMRSTFGDDTEYRAIALWKTEAEAIQFAKMSESMKNSRYIYTYIGGPVELC
jgi:hypothetical protein